MSYLQVIPKGLRFKANSIKTHMSQGHSVSIIYVLSSMRRRKIAGVVVGSICTGPADPSH